MNSDESVRAKFVHVPVVPVHLTFGVRSSARFTSYGGETLVPRVLVEVLQHLISRADLVACFSECDLEAKKRIRRSHADRVASTRSGSLCGWLNM